MQQLPHEDRRWGKKQANTTHTNNICSLPIALSNCKNPRTYMSVKMLT